MPHRLRARNASVINALNMAIRSHDVKPSGFHSFKRRFMNMHPQRLYWSVSNGRTIQPSSHPDVRVSSHTLHVRLQHAAELVQVVYPK